MGLALNLLPKETIVLKVAEHEVRITFIQKTGRRACFSIEAPLAVQVSRQLQQAGPKPLSHRLARASQEADRRK